MVLRFWSSDFFITRLNQKFSIQFLDQEEIVCKEQFEKWYSSVDGLQDVKHDIKNIEVMSISDQKAKVKIHVDWSVRDGNNVLFFPAEQFQELMKVNNQWKFNTL